MEGVTAASKQDFSRLNGCAWNAVSAFANCGLAVAHVQGSYCQIQTFRPTLIPHKEADIRASYV